MWLTKPLFWFWPDFSCKGAFIYLFHFFQVERGQPENINKDEVKEKLDKEEFRLREMMIKKKHKVGYGTFLRNLNKNSSFCKVLKSKCLIKTTFSINFLRYVMTFQRKTENCFRSWRIVLKSTTLYYPKIAVNSNNEKSRFKKELNLQIQWLTCDIFFVLMLLDSVHKFFLIQITENSVKFFYCYFQLEMGKK